MRLPRVQHPQRRFRHPRLFSLRQFPQWKRVVAKRGGITKSRLQPAAGDAYPRHVHSGGKNTKDPRLSVINGKGGICYNRILVQISHRDIFPPFRRNSRNDDGICGFVSPLFKKMRPICISSGTKSFTSSSKFRHRFNFFLNIGIRQSNRKFIIIYPETISYYSLDIFF